MALTPSGLQPAFLGLTRDYPPRPEEAAKKMADAYGAYAQGAGALGGVPVLTGSEKTVIEMMLASVLRNQNGVITAYASAWYNGIVAFWAPVVWTPPPGGTHGPGVVTIPASVSIQSGLVSKMSGSNEATIWAQTQATTLHTGVVGIMTVTFPPIPPTPSPLLAPVL